MAAPPPPPRLLRRLLLGFLLLISPLSSSSSSLGINYGQVANNLPSPEAAVPLLRSIGVSKVKIYDADPTILHAFGGTGIEFIVGLADECVVKVCDSGEALTWVKTNIVPFVPRTKISAITIGNEVLTGNKTDVIRSLFPAMQSIRAALETVGLEDQISVTTPHSLAVLETSYPPSSGVFRKDLVPSLCQILYFLQKTGAPFLVNAYPFFAFTADPKRVSLDYVLFKDNDGVVDAATGLRYENMLHAQVDAVYAAIDRAMGKGKGVEVRVSETGWPSNGDEDETGATAENAKKYNGNLVRLVSKKMGTPMRPNATLQVYIFALFNENMKPGPASERNYGLFKPDGTPAYDLGIKSYTGKGSNGGGGGGGGGGDNVVPVGDGGQNPGNPGFYEFSSSTKAGSFGGVSLFMALLVVVVAFFFSGAADAE